MSRIILRQKLCRHKVRQYKLDNTGVKNETLGQVWTICFRVTDLKYLTIQYSDIFPNLLRVCSVKGTKASCRGRALEAYLANVWMITVVLGIVQGALTG